MLTPFQQSLHDTAVSVARRGGDANALIALVQDSSFRWDLKLWNLACGPVGLMHYLYTFQPWSHVLTVQAMLAHGADLNEVDNTGKPLWYRNWLCPEKLRLYLERGVDPNEIHFDASGKPYLLPLMATARGSITAGADVAGSLHLLLDHGAKIDMQDARGYAALHHAVECDQFSLAFLLLERGADYSVKSNTSPEETALDILLRRSGGREYEREQLTRMLVSYKDRATMLASTASIEATTRGKSRL